MSIKFVCDRCGFESHKIEVFSKVNTSHVSDWGYQTYAKKVNYSRHIGTYQARFDLCPECEKARKIFIGFPQEEESQDAPQNTVETGPYR